MKSISLILAILLFFISIHFVDKHVYLDILIYIQSFTGWKAILLISIVYLLANLLVLPLGLPINMLSGVLYGSFLGGAFINLLATIAAGLGFYIGRYFLEDFISRSSALKRLMSSIGNYDWQFIALARLNPIVPFGLSNYLFGAIPGLSFRHYIIATVFSNALPCFIFAELGSVLGSYAMNSATVKSLILESGAIILLVTLLFAVKHVLPNYLASTDEAQGT